MTRESYSKARRLAEEISVAPIQGRNTDPEFVQQSKDAGETDDPQDPLDIAIMVWEGDVEPQDVPDMIMVYLNYVIDIPFVPESIEARMFGMLADLIEQVVIDRITRIAESVDAGGTR